MKIEDTSGLFASQETQKVQKTTPAFDLFKTYGATASAGVAGSDQAQMSTQAQDIQKYTEKLKALPDIREDKVKELEQRLSTGEYTVPLENVSEMMFRMAELDEPS